MAAGRLLEMSRRLQSVTPALAELPCRENFNSHACNFAEHEGGAPRGAPLSYVSSFAG